MSVCKYYLQGYCRFGDRCRFVHPNPQQQGFGNQFGGGGGGFNRGNFGGGGGQQNRFAPLASQQAKQALNVKDLIPSDIVNLIAEEMKVWEASKMWPFSCFAYAKEGQTLSGLEDLSPEELRQEAYDAQKNNTFATYQQKVAQMATEVNAKRQALQRPTPEFRQKLIQEITDHKKGNTGGSTSGFGQTTSGSASGSGGSFGSSSTFGTSGNKGLFGQSQFGSSGGQQQTSVFGNQQTASQTGLFGSGGGTSSSATPTAGGIFGGGASSNATGAGGIFGGGASSNATGAGGIFGAGASSNATGAGGIFGGGASSNATPATGGIFGGGASSGSTTAQQGGLFGKGTTAGGSVFGGGTGSVFGGGTGSVFGGSSGGVFGGGASPATAATTKTTGLFTGQPVQSTTSTGLFGSGTGQTNQSPFGTQSGSLLQQQQQTGGFANTADQKAAAPQQSSSLYTPLDQLTADEKQQFEAQKFVLGKIPIRPPPKEFV